jgi:hypothetical protein
MCEALHNVWRYTRGPFFHVNCLNRNSHKWELYDGDKAGCLLCGRGHVCCKNVFTNKENCTLFENIDNSVTCTITGLTIPSIRTSENEYYENYSFTRPEILTFQTKYDDVRTYIMFIINDFLLGEKMKQCRIKENIKKIQKIHTNTTRWLKSYKLTHNISPSIHDVIAQALVSTKINFCVPPQSCIINTCVQHITKCVIDCDLIQHVNNKPYFVIGLLYLMKSGLCINNAYWLPRTPSLLFHLPQENSLEKSFGISIKTICETENCIKIILRNKHSSL